MYDKRSNINLLLQVTVLQDNTKQCRQSLISTLSYAITRLNADTNLNHEKGSTVLRHDVLVSLNVSTLNYK